MGLLLLLGVSVNLALTLGMAAVMFLPGPVRRLMSGGLGLLTRIGLVKRPEAAREKVEASRGMALEKVLELFYKEQQ